MKKLLGFGFLFLIFIPCFYTKVSAETIFLKSGKTINGKILEKNDEYIKIDTGAGILIKYYLDEIKNNKEDNSASAEPKKQLNTTDKTQVSKIIGKLLINYENMKSYFSEGTAISEVNTKTGLENITENFSIKLAKPNFFKITSELNHPSLGIVTSALWNSKEGLYVYNGITQRLQKINDAKIALAFMKQPSLGVTYTLPNLFFGYNDNIVSKSKNMILKGTEIIRGEDCYVLEDESQGQTLWISKEKYLIVKSKHIIGKGETTDVNAMELALNNKNALIDTLNILGQEVNDENIAKLKTQISELINTSKNSKLNGKIEEFYYDSRINVELSENDFKFEVPAKTK